MSNPPSVPLDHPVVAAYDHVVVCRLADEWYAIAIEAVQEIVRMQPITPLPGPADGVQGITNLRGSVVPVIDLRPRCGLPPCEPTSETRIVVVDSFRGPVGVIVDSVSEVIRIPACDVDAPAAVISPETKPFIRGVARLPGRLVLLLDVDHLLSTEPRETARQDDREAA